MLNRRCITIIEMLMESKILTVNEISKCLGVSERTIRYDIDKINFFLMQNNLKMITKKAGKGIYLEANTNDKNNIRYAIKNMNTYNYIMSENERIKYILCLLLKSNKYVTIDSMARELSVCRSTIIKDLDKVKAWLKTKNIDVISKKAHGIKIEANEGDIRKAIISLLFSSGMRISELWSLNRDTIDFETKQMCIIGKGNKERTCFMNTETKELLLQYLATRNDDNPALFVNRNGERLGRREIQKFFKKAGLDAGIKKPVTPHKMRHSFGSYMVQHGAPIQVVQQCLGHNDVSTTQIYSFLDNKTISDGYRSIFDKEDK